MNETIFHGSLVLISGLLSLIRLFYGWRACQRGGKVIARRASLGRTAFVWAAAFLLLSANWLVGATWFGLAFASVALIEVEEAALIDTFGEAYRTYMRRTGRLLPRLWH